MVARKTGIQDQLMSDINSKALHDFEALKAGRPLAHLVYDVLRDYPEPYVLATRYAAHIVAARTGLQIDPRFVWWHEFDTAVSSDRTFNGWRHSGRPKKSMRMTDLVMQRFDLFYQDATDQLDATGGFYRQGPNADFFDEHNELRMLAVNVQSDLWALNFTELYRAAIAKFWSKHGADFPVLMKINLLGQAVKSRSTGLIDDVDQQRIQAMAVQGLSGGLPTLEQLRQDGSAEVLSVYRYGLGQEDRASFYSLHASDGRVQLYLPWAGQALRGFASAQAMAGWLRSQLQSAETLNAFLVAALSDPLEHEGSATARQALQGLANSRTDEAAMLLLEFLRTPFTGDVFTQLTVQSRREMERHTAIMVSNGQLRKGMWRGYLSAFLSTFAGLAPLGWPISLSLLGAGVAKLALDVDVAASAADEQTRKQALCDAMFDSLMAALSLTDLSFQSSLATLAYQAPFHEENALISHWQAVQSPDRLLTELEANPLLENERVADGPLQGLHVSQDGSTWVTIKGVTYRVRFSQELSSWLIVSAEDPFAFTALRPVRLTEGGEWELLAPPRLLGGSPPPNSFTPSEHSPFWDEYTQVNQNRSKLLSARARVRQKRLLTGLPTLGHDQVAAEDSDKIYCVMVEGQPAYSYLHEGDGYRNELIDFYTDENSQINKVLRFGEYVHDDADSYIAKLADSLDRLPKSSDVTLYRGGSTARNTGGEHFRSGRVAVGDVLINSDLASFTENPYIVPEFSARLSRENDQVWLFDDSSVIYELPAGRYWSGTPISAFSMYWEEAETIFLPGQYFRIEKINQIYGANYHFIHVVLGQTTQPLEGAVYELRTGQLFDPAAVRARIRNQVLAERFFPKASSQ